MESAIQLAKDAESRKLEIEKLRDLPRDLVGRLKRLGLSRLWVAKTYGGSQQTY